MDQKKSPFSKRSCQLPTALRPRDFANSKCLVRYCHQMCDSSQMQSADDNMEAIVNEAQEEEKEEEEEEEEQQQQQQKTAFYQ